MLFFVTLLPALAHARIFIGIHLSSRADDVKVNLEGEDERLITDGEAEAFGLTHSEIQKEVIMHMMKFGYKPENSSTLWGLEKEMYNLTLVLKPIKATVLSFRSKPTALAHYRYKNNGMSTVQYRADLRQNVTNTVTYSWHKKETVHAGTEISTEVNFAVGKVAAKPSLSYNHQWGKNGSVSQSVTVGSNAGLPIPVTPGATLEVIMLASQGTTDIEVAYEASVHGEIVTWSQEDKRKINFGFLVNFMRPGALPRMREVIEIIKVDYYCDFETLSNHTMVPLE